MAKKILIFLSLALFLSIGLVAATCQLTPQLVNQDPYPAVPGDYVKLVFQVTGIQDPSCGQVLFQLVPNYPISFDPGVSPYATVQSGTYSSNYNYYVMIPYTVRVDPNAIDGNSTIDFRYTPNSANNYSVDTNFNLSVQDVRSNFEVFVKNYDFSTNDLTLEILNIGKNDVQALTIQVPNQYNLTVMGPNYNVVGSLSSEDYSTADFQILPYMGNINLTIYYSDTTGVRRSINQTVYFDPTAFKSTQQNSISPVIYIVIILIILIIIYLFYRRHKKNKKKKLLRE